jgi:hypothetical protein
MDNVSRDSARTFPFFLSAPNAAPVVVLTRQHSFHWSLCLVGNRNGRVLLFAAPIDSYSGGRPLNGCVFTALYVRFSNYFS